MKLKYLSLAFVILGLSPTAFANQCNYESIGGVEYELTDLTKKYVTNNFIYNPNLEDYQQLDKSLYTSLVQNPFKVTKTDIITKSSKDYEGFLSHHRYTDVDFNNKAYKMDGLYNIEVTTKDCKKFYYAPRYKSFDDFKTDLKRTDNLPVTSTNYTDFFKSSLIKPEIQTSQEYDKFEKKVKVRTDKFKNYFIRGNFDTTKNKYDFIQLYLTFNKMPKTDKSAYGTYIRTALDTDGNAHDVVMISSEIDDCKSEVLGCVITNDIGIDLTESFLRKYSDGFELKIMDSKPFVISVSKDVIQSFLNTTDDLKQK